MRFNPGQNGAGEVLTSANARTTFRNDPPSGTVRVELVPGRTWRNEGIIDFESATSLRLFNNNSTPTASTLQNNGTITIAPATVTPIQSMDLGSGLANNLSIVNNNGILNVGGSTGTATIAAAFTNTTSGALNVTSGTVALPNGQTIAGAVDIAAGRRC